MRSHRIPTLVLVLGVMVLAATAAIAAGAAPEERKKWASDDGKTTIEQTNDFNWTARTTDPEIVKTWGSSVQKGMSGEWRGQEGLKPPEFPDSFWLVLEPTYQEGEPRPEKFARYLIIPKNAPRATQVMCRIGADGTIVNLGETLLGTGKWR